ncbi:hypothetical protein LCGC14_2768970, partial [marine sediment metagenome]
ASSVSVRTVPAGGVTDPTMLEKLAQTVTGE